MLLGEIDYKICKAIKQYKKTWNINPKINDIAKIIKYSNEGTRYHTNKLEALGIIEKNTNKEYVLKVKTLK